MSSQPGVAQSPLPIAAPPTVKPEVSYKPPKAVTPPKREPLTIESLLQGVTGQQDPSTIISKAFSMAVPVEQAQPSVALPEEPPESVRVRSRERTPVRHSRSLANFALGARAGLFWRPSRYSYLRGGKCEF